MRALKAAAHVGFRTLEKRAEAAGDVLPKSTLIAVLSRDTLPREEVVAAFVRACGLGEEAVERWLTVRRGIARVGLPDDLSVPVDPPPVVPPPLEPPSGVLPAESVAPSTVSGGAAWLVDFVPPVIWRSSWAVRVIAAVLFALVVLVTLSAVVGAVRDWIFLP